MNVVDDQRYAYLESQQHMSMIRKGTIQENKLALVLIIGHKSLLLRYQQPYQ